MKTKLTFAKRFELKYHFPFIEAKTEEIGADLKGSEFLPETGLATCKRHIWVAKTVLRCLKAFKFVQDEAPQVFGTTNLDDMTIATSRNAHTILQIRAAQHYFTNPDRSKEDFPVHAFYKARAQYVSALRAIFSEGHSHCQSLLALSWVDDFLNFDITLSKYSKTKILILDISANGMRLLQWDQFERMEQFVHGNLIRQNSAMKCMRSVFLGTAPDISSSATPVSRCAERQSAASTSSADPMVCKSYKLQPRTAPSASRPPVQYRELRVTRIPKRRTRSV